MMQRDQRVAPMASAAPTLAVRRGRPRLTGQPHREAADGSPVPALAAAVLGFFVITLDAVVVNVALPSIRRDLGGGITGLQWAVDGYTLMFAALLLSAGAKIWPRRRLLLHGTTRASSPLRRAP